MLATKGMRQASAIRLATTARIDHGQRASWKRGFTLIEAVVTLLVLGILSSLAVNSYNSYIERARAAEAIEQLDLFHKHMEKAFQDNGNYGAGACAVTPPTDVSTVTFACLLGQSGQAFSANATGSGNMGGYVFSINERGFRRTEAFPGASSVPTDCWMVEKDKCR